MFARLQTAAVTPVFPLLSLFMIVLMLSASLVAQMVKNPPASAGDLGSITGSGKSPREGYGHPLQCSCLENGQRILEAYSPWGHKESDTTEQLTDILMLRDKSFISPGYPGNVDQRKHSLITEVSFSQDRLGFAAVTATSQCISGLGTKVLLLDLVQERSGALLGGCRPGDHGCSHLIICAVSTYSTQSACGRGGESGQSRRVLWPGPEVAKPVVGSLPDCREAVCRGKRKWLGLHQADPGGLGLTSSGPGSPTSGPLHLQSTVCCMFK